MREYLRRWVDRYFSDPQVLSMIILLVVGTVLILWLGEMLIPFIAAIIIAYILEGLVIRLESLHIPRGAAILLVFVLFITAIVLFLIGLIPLLSRQVGQLL